MSNCLIYGVECIYWKDDNSKLPKIKCSINAEEQCPHLKKERILKMSEPKALNTDVVAITHSVLCAEAASFRRLKPLLSQLKKLKYGTLEHHSYLEYIYYNLNQSNRAITREMKKAGMLQERKNNGAH